MESLRGKMSDIAKSPDANRIESAPFFRSFIRMAGDSWDAGWHERNGGNLSYRIKSEEIEPLFAELRFGEWQPLSLEVPAVGEEFFLITAAGSYFRNIPGDAQRGCGIIQVDTTGTLYRTCWGFSDGGRPTSELPTHLLAHEVKKLSSGGMSRVVHHSHPANIIALTFVLPLSDEVFTRELWQTISECAMVFPEGVGVVEWGVPGSTELARKTAFLLERVNAVVWAHHGLFCTGNTFDEAFGLMHTIEKAAEILVKVIGMGGRRQTIGTDDLEALGRAYGLELACFS